jgi:cysteine-rich repeat protein
MKSNRGSWTVLALLAACAPKSVDLGAGPGTAGELGTEDGADGGMGNAANNGGRGSAAAGRGNVAGSATAGRGSVAGTSGVETTCGNGRLDAGELCDDGNRLSGDGCGDDCVTLEPGYVCITGTCGWLCGNQVVSSPDQCSAGSCAESEFTPPAPARSGDDQRPCDIYAEDGGPCVAAHSTVRALYARFDGPLYGVRRSDGAFENIAPSEPGGFADSALQDDFCGGGTCSIAVIYDQSGHGNHLTKSPPGGANPTPGNEALATAVSATFGGHKVYGVHVVPGVGYRNDNACATATGDDAETIYMIVGGTFHNAGCCFDYGNMERNNQNNGEGAAEAVYFGKTTLWGKGNGAGPWVMADLENGIWAGNRSPYEPNLSLDFKYVTGMVKGDAAGQNHWTIKTGNAQAGELSTPFDGSRPSARYSPMRKEGAVGLGTSGDNSATGQGDFFEGVMTAHYSTDAADDAVQANVVSIYGDE